MIEGVNEAVNNVRARVERLRAGRAVYLAAKGTMVDVSKRVWDRGELTSGGTLSYKDDYELWAYTPPSPKKVTGKGKPYVDWIVRPESIDEKRVLITKRVAKLKKAYNNTLAQIIERKRTARGSLSGNAAQKLNDRLERISVAIDVAEGRKDDFSKRFGKGARKIKGGFYQSYTEYKKQQGRDDMPFELTGRLRKAYFSSNDAPDSLIQISDTEVVIKLRGEEGKKYEGLTDTKGAFLKLTEAEKAEYQKRVFEIYAE